MYEAPHVARSTVGDVVVLRPDGEFDIAWSDVLRDELVATVVEGHSRLVLDLSGCTFMDSSAIGAIVTAARRAHGAGGWIRLVSPRDNVRRVLRLTQIDTLLGLFESVSDAIDAPERATAWSDPQSSAS